MAVVVSSGLIACAAMSPQVPVRFEMRAASHDAKPGWQKINDARTDPATNVYVAPQPLITNADVADAQASEDGSEHPHLKIDLTPAGTARLAQSSVALVGQEIVTIIDGDILTMATVRAPLVTGKMAIMWLKSPEEARKIARGILLLK